MQILSSNVEFSQSGQEALNGLIKRGGFSVYKMFVFKAHWVFRFLFADNVSK